MGAEDANSIPVTAWLVLGQLLGPRAIYWEGQFCSRQGVAGLRDERLAQATQPVRAGIAFVLQPLGPQCLALLCTPTGGAQLRISPVGVYLWGCRVPWTAPRAELFLCPGRLGPGRAQGSRLAELPVVFTAFSPEPLPDAPPSQLPRGPGERGSTPA